MVVPLPLVDLQLDIDLEQKLGVRGHDGTGTANVIKSEPLYPSYL